MSVDLDDVIWNVVNSKPVHARIEFPEVGARPAVTSRLKQITAASDRGQSDGHCIGKFLRSIPAEKEIG